MSNQTTTQEVFSFFGPPGSGKGTLAGYCVRELEFKVLSTGDLCRIHVAQGTEIGKLVHGYLTRGELIPDEMMTAMVKEWLLSNKHTTSIILDGYPRTQKQAEQFLVILKEVAPHAEFRVIVFDISQEEVIERLANRLVCSNKKCQASFSARMGAVGALCGKCSHVLERRTDDKIDVVRDRLKSFPLTKEKLICFYEDVGVTAEIFSVNSLTPEVVFEKFKKII